MKTYKCASCGQQFKTADEDDAAAVEEARALWGSGNDVADDPDFAVVCDDCFRRVMPAPVVLAADAVRPRLA